MVIVMQYNQNQNNMNQNNTTPKPMESKQITAVEWMFEHLMPFIEFSDAEKREDVRNVLEQAKAMVRQQIAEAYRQGVEEDVYNTPLKTGQEYYTETYGNP